MTAEPDAQAQIELSVSPVGPWIQWADVDGELTAIPIAVAEQIAAQIDSLKDQARVQSERAAFVASLRAVADWAESPGADRVSPGTQTIWLHVDEPADLCALAAAKGADVDTGEPHTYDANWRTLSAELTFGLVKVTLLGRSRVAQDVGCPK
jgi:hypothetical protein